MTLDELAAKVEQVSDLYAERCDIRRDDDWYLLKLQEELGELTQAHLRLTGRARAKDGDLQQARRDEAADVLCTALLYCRRFGIDPEQAVRDKWLFHLESKGHPTMAVILTVGPVARARNGVIGVGGTLPWRLSADLAFFKKTTLGKPVIMGRKTWDSLPIQPLSGRLNIVLSRDGSFEPDGAVVCDSFLQAFQIGREQAQEDGVEEVCVIGGAALFELALPKAKRLYLTEVDAEVEGDTFFPAFNEADWSEVRREHHLADEKNQYDFTIRVLEKRS